MRFGRASPEAAADIPGIPLKLWGNVPRAAKFGRIRSVMLAINGRRT